MKDEYLVSIRSFKSFSCDEIENILRRNLDVRIVSVRQI